MATNSLSMEVSGGMALKGTFLSLLFHSSNELSYLLNNEMTLCLVKHVQTRGSVVFEEKLLVLPD